MSIEPPVADTDDDDDDDEVTLQSALGLWIGNIRGLVVTGSVVVAVEVLDDPTI
jgi:hypothetical protein